MKKLVNFICITLSLVLCLSIVQPVSTKAAKKNSENKSTKDSVWPQGPKTSSISADSAIVMEASTGLILYEKKANKKHYPASITKIMTALLCLENSSLDEVVTFSREAVYGIESGSSHIAIDVGEKLTMKDTLYGIMLESANEACLGAAEHVAGSVNAFVDMMNEKAESLGCKNTHFANPNGLHNDNHYTTAYDMALISQAALKNKKFREITGTKAYTIPKTNLKGPRTWIKNHHQMLNGYKYHKYEYDYCIGGKTGYTVKAGHTLVTFAEKNGMTLICVLMKADGPTAASNEYTDTKSLLDFGFKNYENYSLSTPKSQTDTDTVPLFTRYSSLFSTVNIPLYVSKDSNIILPKNVDLNETERSLSYNNLTAFQEGENVVGTVTYTYDGKTVGAGDIIYNNVKMDSLVTKTKVSQVHRETALNSKCTLNTASLIYIIIGCAVVISLIYYIFIIQARRKKNSYYQRTHRHRFRKKHY